MPDRSRLRRIEAAETGSASASAGGVAVSGVVVGDVSIHAWTPVTSRYLRQVQQIAPHRLLDRERELADLETFCAAEDVTPYLRWRAPAWAGKSALLAWFVLHPPPRVRVVSFFVTARSSAHSDRTAFADVVMEQLAELLGEPMPPYLTDATREVHLEGMLTLSAEACRAHGERLVLVVDGLDEDLGVTVGADARSIAALLPREPPAGMRVIVSGRPNPPLPDDVPDDHPLRDPASVRDLAKSVHAQVVRHDAQRELKRLQHGTQFEQDLLGLLVAAGGALSSLDLAELTGQSAQQVDDLLAAVAGRTFEVRSGRWRPNVWAYVLGHEELRRQAVVRFGTDALKRYRQRLHDWAARYRGDGWPTGTPEYLLSGYFQLLHQTGDLTRMLEHALDNARHDRMLELTGSDTSAVVEIDTALEYIHGQDEPDLVAMALLALYRDHIGRRNADIAGELCALWVVLGDPLRAELLASGRGELSAAWTRGWSRAIELAVSVAETGAHDRALALATVISEPVARSRVQRAAATAMAEAAEWDRAEALARAIADSYQRTQALRSMAEAALRAGDCERARSLATDAATSTVTVDPGWLAQARREVAETLARTGNPDGAVALANSMTEPAQRDAALVGVVEAIADKGDPDRALAIVDAITDPAWSAPGLALAALSALRAGAPDRCATLVDRSLAVADSIADPTARADTLRRVAVALAAAGDYDRAEAVARSIAESRGRNVALERVAAAAARAGRHDRAEALARTMGDAEARTLRRVVVEMARAGDDDRAEALARSISSPNEQLWALRTLALERAERGECDRAADVAYSIQDPRRQADALLYIGVRWALDGDRDRLAALVERIEALVGSDPGPRDQAQVLIRLATALALAGDRDRALSLAERAQSLRQGSAPPWHEQAMTTVSSAMRHAEEGRRSARLTARADAVIRLVAGPSSAWSYAVAALGRATGRSRGGDAVPSRGELTENLIRAIVYKNNLGTAFLVPGRWQEQTLRVVATMAALAGDHRRAAILADLIAEQDEQDEARRALAITAAGAGDHDRAQAMINLIQTPRRRTQALADVALATLCLGNPDRATVVTQAINDRRGRDRALADLAAAAALLGDRERAETMVRSVSDQNVRASALATLAVVLASHGDYRRAETLARSITTEHRQVEALSVVAAALAIAGEYDRAEELARSLPDSTKQVTALAQVADWAPPATARRLLAEALYRGRATIVLGTVARIDAHVTATVCEKLRELAEATSTPSQSPA